MIRRVIRNIDDVFLNKSMQRYRYKKSIERREAALSEGLGYKFVVHHKKQESDLISQLCEKYGSDKGGDWFNSCPWSWLSHTYAYYYSSLFAHNRQSVRKVFECGLGTNNVKFASNMGLGGKPGASLRVWRDYFPNAVIYGADIDRDILFEEDRIKAYYIDQRDPSTIEIFWRKVGVIDFDIMIDDGLHTFDAGSCLFEHSISKISQNGIYIIEDVTLDDLLMYKTFFSTKDFVVDYVIMFRPGAELDSSLVVIKTIIVRRRWYEITPTHDVRLRPFSLPVVAHPETTLARAPPKLSQTHDPKRRTGRVGLLFLDLPLSISSRWS